MAEPIRIANCSGFFGDRLSAAAEMVNGGNIDVLTGDWLAELTMFILSRSQARPGGHGYARTFVTQMEQVLGTCHDRGIKVVSNAGGLDPAGCAAAVADVSASLGLSISVAYVDGDNLLARAHSLGAAGLVHLDNREPFTDMTDVVTANAYLGCWGIVDALRRGADVVITGRTTDAALVCGPAAWHHQWARDDWSALAGAVVAGHVIECGTQATGGNYSFFAGVPGMERVGFPWAEIAADGSSTIGKHDGTGGEVSIGTVTSQLLYEIGGPLYLGPDVDTRFDTIQLEMLQRDRVRISGATGSPPSGMLKVAVNELGGYRSDLSVAITGLDVDRKAELLERAFWAACPIDRDAFDSVTTAVARTAKADPETNEEAVSTWRLVVKDRDQSKVGRVLGDTLTELGLATIPGFFGVDTGRGGPKQFGVYRPALLPATEVRQWVVVLGGERTEVQTTPTVRPPVSPASTSTDQSTPTSAPTPATGATRRAALGTVIGGRSGDKGGTANLGVFALDEDIWSWIDSFLTVEQLHQLLPETRAFPIERHRLPLIRSLNFVIHGLLQEGVAASTRPDPQAKGLAEWLRARSVDIPVGLLSAAPTGGDG